MIRPGKILIVGAIIAAVLVVLFYLLPQREDEDIDQTANIPGQPIISWQKIKITEEEKNVLIDITVPRIIIGSSYNLDSEINKAITWRVDLLKSEFISGVTTAAYDNGETNTLNIDTEVLLITPRLVSFAFTTAEHLAGIGDNDPERTFIIFDLVNGKSLKEGNELFRDVSSWREAIKAMKASLLADYQGDPNCDLFFAPKQNGFSMSCIGVDYSLGGKQISLTKDIPISMVQEFLTPSVLSDVTQ